MNLKCKFFFRPRSQGSLLCLEPVATEFSAVAPIWNNTAERASVTWHARKSNQKLRWVSWNQVKATYTSTWYKHTFYSFYTFGDCYVSDEDLFSIGKKTRSRLQPHVFLQSEWHMALLQSSLLFSITHQPHCIKEEGKGLKKTLVPLLHIASKGKTQTRTFYMQLSNDPVILFTCWNESAWNAFLNATFSCH